MQQITKNKLRCSNPDIWQLHNVETEIAHTNANISFFFFFSPSTSCRTIIIIPLSTAGGGRRAASVALKALRAAIYTEDQKTDLQQLAVWPRSIKRSDYGSFNLRWSLLLKATATGESQEPATALAMVAMTAGR